MRHKTMNQASAVLLGGGMNKGESELGVGSFPWPLLFAAIVRACERGSFTTVPGQKPVT
jgi:hypothetical protein